MQGNGEPRPRRGAQPLEGEHTCLLSQLDPWPQAPWASACLAWAHFPAGVSHREPVTRDEAEDYYDVIEHPMDFQTIQSRCSCGNYRSVQEFLTDVKQVFANAELYNCRGSHVLSCMEKTEQCLLALLQKHLPGHPYVRRKRRKFPDRLADEEGDSDAESVGQSRGRRQKK